MRVLNAGKQPISLSHPDHAEVVIVPDEIKSVPDKLLKALAKCPVTDFRFKNGDLVDADELPDPVSNPDEPTAEDLIEAIEQCEAAQREAETAKAEAETAKAEAVAAKAEAEEATKAAEAAKAEWDAIIAKSNEGADPSASNDQADEKGSNKRKGKGGAK